MITIDIASEQSNHPVNESRLRTAVTSVLDNEGIASATISIAVVDDDTIHDLNRRYLNHDYATDVLSFVLDQNDEGLGGEIVISADTAAESATRFGWSAEDEMLLYVIHGSLHLVGYDDRSPDEKQTMRERETHYLKQFGLAPHYVESTEKSGENLL